MIAQINWMIWRIYEIIEVMGDLVESSEWGEF